MHQEIYSFWFKNLELTLDYANRMNAIWFAKDPDFDAYISENFKELILRAGNGELDSWESTDEGLVALIILMDQFSRNAFRGTPRMYEFDQKALSLVNKALAEKRDQSMNLFQRLFLYLPFEHSEDLTDQKTCLSLFQETLDEYKETELEPVAKNYLSFAESHYVIIEDFGRFPHRNEILGRQSTDRELEFLKSPNSKF